MSARDVLNKSKSNSYSNSNTRQQEEDDSQARQGFRGRSLGGKRRFNPPYKRNDDDGGDAMPSKRPRLDSGGKKEEKQERNPILDDERVQGMDEVRTIPLFRIFFLTTISKNR